MVSSENCSYYIISLGCSKNLVDSERINGFMIGAGFKSAVSSENADILIINTCGFIKTAKEESIEVILEEINRVDSRWVVVTGCLSQRYFEEIKREIPEIDFLYRIADDRFVTELSGKLKIKIKKGSGGTIRKALFGHSIYSYIKISEGCSNNCNYCSIPLIRGPHKSYPADMLIKEAELAAFNGARELLIIAQDITAYNWKEYRLPGLVNRISEIEGVEWIRLLYCHPDHITDDIIDLVRSNDRVVKYIDIPFQHVSGDILKSMGRMGDSDKYHDLILKLRSAVPEIRIRSTFMIGYPGESENDFMLILKFLERAKLDRVGGFMFSREENTSAYRMKNQVPERIKKSRYNKFMELQSMISGEKLKAMVGREVRVIVEERVDDISFMGRTEFDAPEVDGVFFLTAKKDVLNTIVRARVTGAVEYDLMGEMV